MPEENETNDLEVLEEDDDLELQEQLAGAAEELGEEEAGAVRELQNAPETRLYRRAMESPMSINQSLAFLAAVELDELRKTDERIGLKPLFNACVEHGGPAWLNPARYLARLHNTVLSYSGPHRTITPFVELLTDLAERGISPAAFCRYVLAPRMFKDYDWRNWERNHLSSLRRIAHVLLELRERAPFNVETIETAYLTLSRDVVLVKYVGRPLARIPEQQLADGAVLDEYQEAWANTGLRHSFFVYFMKRNLMPLLYWMSGRTALGHLTELVKRMPVLERTFEEELPEALFNTKPGDPPLHLYAKNYDASLQARRQNNYRFADFLREMNAYLDMIRSLLRTRSGLYVCSYYAMRLRRGRRPELAELFRDLVEVLIERRGLYYYTWHLRRLLGRDFDERRPYLEFLRENEGCDPEYPDVAGIFAVDPFADGTDVEDLARDLGLRPGEDFDLGPDLGAGADGSVAKPTPYNELLNAYLAKYPERKPLLDQCVDDVINARDRHWDAAMDRDLDDCGASLHPVILRALIPGLGRYFSHNVKSDGFRSLRRLYGRANDLPDLGERLDFRMPVQEQTSLDRLKEQEARKQLNLEKTATVWKYLTEDFDSASDGGARRLGTMLLELRRSLETREAPVLLKEGRLADLKGGGAVTKPNSDEVAGPEEIAAEIVRLEKEIKKERKPVNFIREKVERLNSLAEMYPTLKEEQRVITLLLTASSESKPGSDEQRFAFSVLYERYREENSLAERMNFLREDVVLDMLDIQQLLYIINVLDLLNRYLMHDEALQKAAAGDGSDSHRRWSELLVGYVRVRDKTVSMDSLEAAYRNIVMLGKLNAELGRWRDIMARIDAGDAKYFRSLSLITSKSFFDAYYGDMGGICLASIPQAINHKGFYNIRLVDHDGRNIIGMGLLRFSGEGIRSRGIRRFCFAFAFNPLASYVSSLSRNQQLYVYLQYRLLLETISTRWEIPVVLPGIGFGGIISNHGALEDLITGYERTRGPPFVRDARGLALMYDEIDYAQALVIIEPEKPASFRARVDMEKLLPGATQAI